MPRKGPRRRRGVGRRRPVTPGGPPLPPDVGGLPSREEMGTWKRQFGQERTREGRSQFWGSEEGRTRRGAGRGAGRAFRMGEEMAGRPSTPAPVATPGVPPAAPTPTPTPSPRRSQAPVTPSVPLPWETPTPGERAPDYGGRRATFHRAPGELPWGLFRPQPRTVPGPEDWLPYHRNWYEGGGQYTMPPGWQSDAGRPYQRPTWAPPGGWDAYYPEGIPYVDPWDWPRQPQGGSF